MKIVLIRKKIFGRWTGMALPPFLILVWSGSKDPMRTIRHKWTHVLQAIELWIIGFYPVYLWEWIRAGFSYRNNRMEVEAYDHDDDPSYNGQRKPFSWKK